MKSDQSTQATIARRAALNQFLIGVQAYALKQAEYSVKHREEAMDIVQDAMLKLAKNYFDQEDNWPKLFQRILQNTINDCHRRRKVRQFFSWNSIKDDSNDELHSCEFPSGQDVLQRQQVRETVVHAVSPELDVQWQQQTQRVEVALRELPRRQQQVFMLRAWLGNDIKETAFAMGCSVGSVKTHYSRAVSRLRELLGGSI